MRINNQKAVINKQKCIGCGACIAVCPVNAIKMDVGWSCFVKNDKCIGCGKCVSVCHKHAPTLEEASR